MKDGNHSFYLELGDLAVGSEVIPSIDPKVSQANKKVSFNAIPLTILPLIAQANQDGADKYGKYNWLELPDDSMVLSTYINAMERHLLLLKAGQDFTSDGSHVHHLAAIIAGAAVALDALVFGKLKDDRVKLSPEQLEIFEKLINKQHPLQNRGSELVGGNL